MVLLKFLAGNMMRQLDTELTLDLPKRSDVDWYAELEGLSAGLSVDGFRFGQPTQTEDRSKRIPIEQYGQEVSAAEVWCRLFPDDPAMHGKIRVFVSWSGDTIDKMDVPRDSISDIRRWNRRGVPGFPLFQRYVDVVRTDFLGKYA